jgi:SAM-dependent methyltransferase/uncharacterized protein YbaR (Trm112 family)
MRRGHFETIAPVCPLCRGAAGEWPLVIAEVVREEGQHIIEALLHCTNAECRREYPVIDGIPILVGPIRAWLAANPLQLLGRDDLSPRLESLVGDVLGPGSAYDTLRQHVGIYAADHYGTEGGGSLQQLLERMLHAAALVPDVSIPHDSIPDGPMLDAGCSVGGATFALAAKFERPIVGVDLNFAMLRLAATLLRDGHARYPQRRAGIVYDWREIAPPMPHRELVDFWCCDVMALPFAAQSFGLVTSLNVIDCVASPREALSELARVTRGGGRAIVSTPYDWSSGATPVEQWLGGHSQRGPGGGAPEPLLRALLSRGHAAAINGVSIVAEEEHIPWRVRLHDRSSVEYDVHGLVLRKEDA